MPAMKAPSASDRPASSVSQARPSVTSSRFSTNSSSLLRRATSVEPRAHRRAGPTEQQHARARTAALTRARCRSRMASSSGRLAQRRDQHQQRHHGEVLEQQHAHHARGRARCRARSRSASIFETIAVEHIASAPPSDEPGAASVQRRGRPSTPSTRQQPDGQRPPARSPRPNTMRRIARSLGRLNSSPIENIRNTTPNSASVCVASPVSATRASACGPDHDARRAGSRASAAGAAMRHSTTPSTAREQEEDQRLTASGVVHVWRWRVPAMDYTSR